jgi:hypothetical protein
MVYPFTVYVLHWVNEHAKRLALLTKSMQNGCYILRTPCKTFCTAKSIITLLLLPVKHNFNTILTRHFFVPSGAAFIVDYQVASIATGHLLCGTIHGHDIAVAAVRLHASATPIPIQVSDNDSNFGE